MAKYTLAPYHKDKKNLCELFQSVELKFSFARVEGTSVKRIHDWVKCRDFLGDVIYSNNIGRPEQIYGFAYDPKADIPIHDEHLVLLVKFPSLAMKKRFIVNSTIIDKANINNNAEPMTIAETSDKMVLLTISDARWQRNIPLLSYYTFLMKVMGYNLQNPDNWVAEIRAGESTSEREYINNILDSNLDLLYTRAFKMFDSDEIHGYPEGTTIGIIHNSSGFYSVCRKDCYAKTTFAKEFKEYVKALEGQGKAVSGTNRKPRKVATPISAAAAPNQTSC